jgi:hypothetical protein
MKNLILIAVGLAGAGCSFEDLGLTRANPWYGIESPGGAGAGGDGGMGGAGGQGGGAGGGSFGPCIEDPNLPGPIGVTTIAEVVFAPQRSPAAQAICSGAGSDDVGGVAPGDFCEIPLQGVGTCAPLLDGCADGSPACLACAPGPEIPSGQVAFQIRFRAPDCSAFELADVDSAVLRPDVGMPETVAYDAETGEGVWFLATVDDLPADVTALIVPVVDGRGSLVTASTVLFGAPVNLLD